MAKKKSTYFCNECGYESSGWLGKCPACSAWNTFTEEPKVAKESPKHQSWLGTEVQGRATEAQALDNISGVGDERFSSGLSELDRVLGGGFVRGSLVLIGGDPGIGKSTLLLQVIGALAKAKEKIQTIYVSGEESPIQIRLRADRLGIPASTVRLLPQCCFEVIADVLDKERPDFMVVDSIQTIYSDSLNAAPGSVSQVRECTAGLLRLAKSLGTCIVLVGHVTKDGAIAGPRVLEHMVDTVLYFEGESQQSLRILRTVKNRFGTSEELGLFEMSEVGLISVENPSESMLSGRPINVPGSIITSSMEGTRPLLLEIQALLTPSAYSQPVRTCQGIDRLRLSMLLAVLSRQSRKDLQAYDAYINVTGGITIRETAADLALLAAVMSSVEGKALPADMIILGEVGLSGEVRVVSQTAKRVSDAIRLGWKRFILPSQCERQLQRLEIPAGVSLFYVSLISEALDMLFTS